MPRFRMIAGGIALGSALAAALALAGVIQVRVSDTGRLTTPAPSALAGPLTATQPELADALLEERDLPDGYRSAPATRPAPVEDGDRTERCRALFERPWDVAGGARDRAVGDYAARQRPALLRQALSLFEPGGAARAVGELRRASGTCPEFDARLEDGTAVRVQLREMALREVGDEAYAVRLSTRPLGRRDTEGTQDGYLAVGRLGPVLSVLRHLGPSGTVDTGQVADMLHQTLRRAESLVRPLTAHESPGLGKITPCRLCASPSPR